MDLARLYAGGATVARRIPSVLFSHTIYRLCDNDRDRGGLNYAIPSFTICRQCDNGGCYEAEFVVSTGVSLLRSS